MRQSVFLLKIIFLSCFKFCVHSQCNIQTLTSEESNHDLHLVTFQF